MSRITLGEAATRAPDAPLPSHVGVLSVGMDLGAGRRGVDMGPSAIRIAGLTKELEALGRDPVELGSIRAQEPETTVEGDAPARYLSEIIQVSQRSRDRIREGMAGGLLPLVLGGDHSISLGSVAAVADHHRQESGREIGLIWVDAHTDMNTPETSPSGNVHGMVLAALVGRGPEGLAKLAERTPAVSPDNICVLGARSVDRTERSMVEGSGIRVFTMSEIDDRGMPACIDEALMRAADGTAGVHLSFDLDSIDPKAAPGVGTPVSGGLTYREAHLVCEKAAGSGRLVSLEVVELNPVLDSGNRTAQLAVVLIESALGKTIL